MSDEVSLYEIMGQWTSRLSLDLDLCETGCGQRRSYGKMMCLEHCNEHIAMLESVTHVPDDVDIHQQWLDGRREQYLKEHRSLWMAWT